MGWKNVKEHYRIGHIVRVVEGKGICIGSPYVHDLLVIGADGSLKRNADVGRNYDLLDRYQREMEADPEKLRNLIETPDSFERSIAVYTYDYSGNIVEKQCEAPDWPNVTHDGCLMYSNTFSTDRAQVVEWAKSEMAASVDNWRRRVAEIECDLAQARRRLAQSEAAAAKLVPS